MQQPGLIQQVKALVLQNGGWEHIFSRYAGLRLAMDRYPAQVPCPHDHTGQTVFRLMKGWQDTGKAYHNQEGCLTDGLNTLAFTLGVSIGEAAKIVIADAGGNLSSVDDTYIQKAAAPRPYCSPDERIKRVRKMQKLWKEAIPVRSSQIAMKYLINRGIHVENLNLSSFERNLMFHPSVEYWEFTNNHPKLKGKFPAILAKFKNPRGKNVTIHRIYLEPDGSRKLNVEEPKRVMQPICHMTGGAFQLGEPMKIQGGLYLGVSEGIENALGVTSVTRTPVWPLYSDSVMASFEPPEGVIGIGIWIDKEPSKAGLAAADKLRDRMQERGIRVQYFYPDVLPAEKLDWLDVINHDPTLVPMSIYKK